MVSWFGCILNGIKLLLIFSVLSCNWLNNCGFCILLFRCSLVFNIFVVFLLCEKIGLIIVRLRLCMLMLLLRLCCFWGLVICIWLLNWLLFVRWISYFNLVWLLCRLVLRFSVLNVIGNGVLLMVCVIFILWLESVIFFCGNFFWVVFYDMFVFLLKILLVWVVLGINGFSIVRLKWLRLIIVCFVVFVLMVCGMYSLVFGFS